MQSILFDCHYVSTSGIRVSASTYDVHARRLHHCWFANSRYDPSALLPAQRLGESGIVTACNIGIQPRCQPARSDTILTCDSGVEVVLSFVFDNRDETNLIWPCDAAINLITQRPRDSTSDSGIYRTYSTWQYRAHCVQDLQLL
jgi:hypothetical protein